MITQSFSPFFNLCYILIKMSVLCPFSFKKNIRCTQTGIISVIAMQCEYSCRVMFIKEYIPESEHFSFKLQAYIKKGHVPIQV